jgi:hypothetical protein
MTKFLTTIILVTLLLSCVSETKESSNKDWNKDSILGEYSYANNSGVSETKESSNKDWNKYSILGEYSYANNSGVSVDFNCYLKNINNIKSYVFTLDYYVNEYDGISFMPFDIEKETQEGNEFKDFFVIPLDKIKLNEPINIKIEDVFWIKGMDEWHENLNNDNLEITFLTDGNVQIKASVTDKFKDEFLVSNMENIDNITLIKKVIEEEEEKGCYDNGLEYTSNSNIRIFISRPKPNSYAPKSRRGYIINYAGEITGIQFMYDPDQNPILNEINPLSNIFTENGSIEMQFKPITTTGTGIKLVKGNFLNGKLITRERWLERDDWYDAEFLEVESLPRNAYDYLPKLSEYAEYVEPNQTMHEENLNNYEIGMIEETYSGPLVTVLLSSNIKQEQFEEIESITLEIIEQKSLSQSESIEFYFYYNEDKLTRNDGILELPAIQSYYVPSISKLKILWGITNNSTLITYKPNRKVTQK